MPGKYIHGGARRGLRSAEYSAYYGAKSRCQTSNHPKYPSYGGRGIEFRFTSFEEFLLEVGPRPTPDHTLDRKNNDGHYEPGNLHWATRSEQQRNQRCSRFLTVNGITKNVSEWANGDNRVATRMYARIDYGWCPECTIHNGKRENCPHISRKRDITINGIAKNLTDWCKHFHISKDTVKSRLHRGWKLHKALTTPLMNRWGFK